jgi:hypothetical protein
VDAQEGLDDEADGEKGDAHKGLGYIPGTSKVERGCNRVAGSAYNDWDGCWRP